jgi:hypothetical protein
MAQEEVPKNPIIEKGIALNEIRNLQPPERDFWLLGLAPGTMPLVRKNDRMVCNQRILQRRVIDIVRAGHLDPTMLNRVVADFAPVGTVGLK